MIVSCSEGNKELSNGSRDSTPETLAKQKTEFDLTGTWEWNESSSTFNLTLKQISDSITGHYCAGYDNGNRTDCFVDEGDECILHGTVHGNSAIVSFTSCYAGATGRATLTFDNSTKSLTWDLIGTDGGEMYAPDSVTLKRSQTRH